MTKNDIPRWIRISIVILIAFTTFMLFVGWLRMAALKIPFPQALGEVIIITLQTFAAFVLCFAALITIGAIVEWFVTDKETIL